ncbi:MAG: SIS domain-containing protein [Alphaproteobacteria bacterium]|nr:SIS domain-containing protein [Alphaproteobacteria bacterium]
MDPKAYFEKELAAHADVLNAVRTTLADPFVRMLDVWTTAIEHGNKIVFFGNGGSAGDAQHLATELAIRYIKDRPPIAAMALTTDSSALTAAGNDLGFEQLFARQITALCKPGDVAVAISTSGRSSNVIAGLKEARRMGVIATALGGRDGGDMVALADPIIIVPDQASARIQEMHITLGQMLCGALEIRLGLVTE